MATDNYIRVPPDGAGKKVRTFEVVASGATVQQHVSVLVASDGSEIDYAGSIGNALGVYPQGEDPGVGWKTMKVTTNPYTGEDGLLVSVMPYGDAIPNYLTDSSNNEVKVTTAAPSVGDTGVTVYNVPTGTQTISGSVTAAFNAIGNSYYGARTVSTAATQLLTSDNARKQFIITNNGNGYLYLGMDGSVAATGANMGVMLTPGGSFSQGGNDGYYTGNVYAVYSEAATTQNVAYWVFGFSA